MIAEIRSCVVAGGNGHVGHLFASLLAASGVEVTSVDIAPPVPDDDPRIRHERADVTIPSGRVAEAIAQADMVLLAVSESVALASVAPVAAVMKRGALLVDTLSVKNRIAPLVLREARHLEAVSLNPMFAPSLGMEGRPVAVIRLHDGPRSQTLLGFLGSWGARAVAVDAGEHDHLTAVTQAATHAAVLAFGVSLREWGVGLADLAAIATPPHLCLLALLARIVSGSPEVYWDVQVSNPEAPAARAALRRGIDRLSLLAEGGSEVEFQSTLKQLRGFIGIHGPQFEALCAHIFAAIPQCPPRESLDVRKLAEPAKDGGETGV